MKPPSGKKILVIILILMISLVVSTVDVYGVDREQLIAAVAAAEARNPANYTPESWARVESILPAARAMRTLQGISQGVIDDITSDLLFALSALVRLEQPRPLDPEILAALNSILYELENLTEHLTEQLEEMSYNQASANAWLMFLLAAITGLSIAKIFSIVWGSQ